MAKRAKEFERVGGGSFDVYQPKKPKTNWWMVIFLILIGLIALGQFAG